MIKIWIGLLVALIGVLVLGQLLPGIDLTPPIIGIVVTGFLTLVHAIGRPLRRSRNANPENTAGVDFNATDWFRDHQR